jgi:hypothetical protein
LLNTLANPDYNIVLRGAVTLKNMINSHKEVAEKVLETQLMECLQAHIFRAKLDEGSYEPDQNLIKVKAIAEETLKAAHDMNVVRTQEESAAIDDAAVDEIRLE